MEWRDILIVRLSDRDSMQRGGEAEPTVFSGEVVEADDRYVVELPREIERSPGIREGPYRVAIVARDEEPIRVSPRGQSERTTGTDRRQPTADRTAPVEVDETLTVTIQSDGDRGDGVAKVNGGFVLFVPDTSVGDEVLVRVTEVHGTYARAESIKRLG